VGGGKGRYDELQRIVANLEEQVATVVGEIVGLAVLANVVVQAIGASVSNATDGTHVTQATSTAFVHWDVISSSSHSVRQ